MARLITLFTGQWADLPFETMCGKASEFGYDGLELACWGDHFEVDKALADDRYVEQRWEILRDHGLDCQAISNHLVGQATCDLIDERHKEILPPEVWGDGDPEGVRKRAAQRMIDTAKAARKFMDAKPDQNTWGVKPAVVNGFTGSPIWHSLYAFPPTSQDYWQKGFDDFAKRWKPILDEFDKLDVNFGLEAHPTEIAFDIASSDRAVKALSGHKRFGFNFDPSHFGYQHVDYVKFIYHFADRINHVHMKDVWWGRGTGEAGVFGGHTDFADHRRYWDFRSVGRGDIDFESIIVALNDIGYQGPLSVEWEDSRMDREAGATEAAEFCHSIDFSKSEIAFDAQFDR
ncbi:MAG: sugar phosphate isomerase/epimerase family protein [Phycisphaeraceae bacterium]